MQQVARDLAVHHLQGEQAARRVRTLMQQVARDLAVHHLQGEQAERDLVARSCGRK